MSVRAIGFCLFFLCFQFCSGEPENLNTEELKTSFYDEFSKNRTGCYEFSWELTEDIVFPKDIVFLEKGKNALVVDFSNGEVFVKSFTYSHGEMVETKGLPAFFDLNNRIEAYGSDFSYLTSIGGITDFFNSQRYCLFWLTADYNPIIKQAIEQRHKFGKELSSFKVVHDGRNFFVSTSLVKDSEGLINYVVFKDGKRFYSFSHISGSPFLYSRDGIGFKGGCKNIERFEKPKKLIESMNSDIYRAVSSINRSK